MTITKYPLYALLLLLIFYSPDIFNQNIQGCTDPNAKNYNPIAVVNDGNCKYPVTRFTPALKTYLSKEVNETSGLAFFNNGLWTMNDSGGKPVLYKIDTLTGKVLQRITVINGTNRDWEDLTTDDKYVYIGDFGNNSGNRDDLKIYKIKIRDIPEKNDDSVKAQVIEFKFSDRKNNKIRSRRYNNFDCEAFTVAGDSLLLFSKNWENQKTRIYTLPKKPGKYTAVLIDSLDVSGLITAADYNEKNRELVLLGYKNRSWIPFIWVIYSFKPNDFIHAYKRRISMPKIITTQTEGIAFTKDKNVYISAERTKIGKQSLYELNTGKWTTLTSAEELSQSSKNIIYNIDVLSDKKIKVYLKNKLDKDYSVFVYDLSYKKIHVKKIRYRHNKRNNILIVKIKPVNKGEYILQITSGASQSVKNFEID